MKDRMNSHITYEKARHPFAAVVSLSKKEKINLAKILIPSVTVIFYLTYILFSIFGLGHSSKAQTVIPINRIQQGIAEEIIRFHVIGNSNSEEDQNVKLKVKEAVIEEMKPYLSNVHSKEEAKALLLSHLDDMKETAEETLTANGFTYGASISLGLSTFPVKQYGDIILPPGEYEALRIELGSASGKNWWCIMFPQLCFVDSTYHVVPDESKAELKYLLTDEEYDAIVSEDTEVVVHFKLFDWVKNLFD